MTLAVVPKPIAVDHADPTHAQFVLVDWMLGNSCNYACSYCPAALHDGSITWQRKDAVLWLMDRLAEHYTVGLERKVWLQFTGGEPTMYPFFFEIMAASRSHGFRQSVISNGSRTSRFWRKAVAVLDNVILTYHDEFAEHSKFLETCRLLAERIPLHVNVTMHPDRFDSIAQRTRDIAEAAPNASITLKPLRKSFGDELYPYTDEQLRRLSDRVSRAGAPKAATPRGIMEITDDAGGRRRFRANDILVEGLNQWRGWRCHAGLESLRVKASGEVLRSVCGVGGVIGHLGGTLTLPVTSVRCTRQSCACVADILISKSRPV